MAGCQVCGPFADAKEHSTRRHYEHDNRHRPLLDNETYYTKEEFYTGKASVEEKKQREQMYAKKNGVLMFHQAKTKKRLDSRSEFLDGLYEKDASKWEYKRSSHIGHSTFSAVDPLTKDYLNNKFGADLRKEDTIARQRAAERGVMMYRRSNSFNPITGEPVGGKEAPPTRSYDNSLK